MGFKKAGKSGPSGGQLKKQGASNRKMQRGGRGKPVSVGRRGKSPLGQQGPSFGAQDIWPPQGYPIGAETDLPCGDSVICFETFGQSTCVPSSAPPHEGICADWIGDQEILGSNPDGSLIFSQIHTTMEPGWGLDASGNKVLVDRGGTNGGDNGNSDPPGGGCMGGECWGDWNCYPFYCQSWGCDCCGPSGPYGDQCADDCSYCSTYNWQPRCKCFCNSE